MRAPVVLLSLLIVVGAAGRVRAQGDESDAETARLDKEATVLFATVIKDLPEPPGLCEIEAKWSDYGVSYEIARDAVGLRVHADLQNPALIAAPAAVIGPAVVKGVVCDDALRKSTVAAAIATWQKAFHALSPGLKPPPVPSDYRRRFSFPLFDANFKRAVLIRQGEGAGIAFDDKGERKRTVISGGGAALVYARDSTGWHKINEVELYIVD